MRKRMMAAALAAMLLAAATVPACGDFGSGGDMISPAVLTLIPESSLMNRLRVVSGNYSWSYAPLYFKPEEREEAEACGPAATDPEVYAGTEHLKLPGDAGFTVDWTNGWAPDSVIVSAWSTAVFEHPGMEEECFQGTEDVKDQRITLKPDRVYQFHAVWEASTPDEETGTADYFVVTESMTEEELAAAKARVGGDWTEEDLRFLTLKIGGLDCVIGKTTPQELIDGGLYYLIDYDGCVGFTLGENGYGYAYAYTAGGGLDEPIISVNAFWAYDLPIEYYGFDGVIGDVNTDPDNTRLDPEDRWTEEDLKERQEDDWFENSGRWGGLVAWMTGELHADQSVEGIYETVVTLSNGREVSISSHDSPVSLALLPERAP